VNLIIEENAKIKNKYFGYTHRKKERMNNEQIIESVNEW
jgi:hypothetical protein